jgi:hypothetical protein
MSCTLFVLFCAVLHPGGDELMVQQYTMPAMALLPDPAAEHDACLCAELLQHRDD